MALNYLYKAGWFVGLVLLQALVLNNVHIADYATPFLYIYLLLKFESDVSRNELLLWAFGLGLAVDVFSDTPGMNAAACVLLAFVRPQILQLFIPRDTVGSIVPASQTMGVYSFLKYMTVCVFLHHLVLLLMEHFSFVHIGILSLKVLLSTVLTSACILAMEGIRKGGGK